MSQRSTLKFFRLRRADYLLKNTSASCTFWEPDPLRFPRQSTDHRITKMSLCLALKRCAFDPR